MITQEIIRKAQQGDSEAFTRIYNETIKTAYYVAKRILLDEQAVEDVLQESYIAVYEHLGEYKAGNLQGWVDTIVANRSKNYLRKKNPILFSQMETEENINIEFEEEKIEFRPDVKVDYDETKRLVMNIVDGLSDEQRLAVILFYFEQRSVKEIAEICECSENTVKSRLNYARKKIKEDVLELEKKGTKLYSIAVLPFLYWLFKEEFMVCEVPVSTNTNVANVTKRVIEQTTGSTTETVAKVAMEETVKTSMALGTKIAIGVAVATISIGGIALGSTLLKDDTTPTEQSSEGASRNNTEVESEEVFETEQETEQGEGLYNEKVQKAVHEFLVTYKPEDKVVDARSQIDTSFSVCWCNDTPIVFMKFHYYVQRYTTAREMYCFYYMDKTSGEILEMEKPACMEDGAWSYSYEICVRESDIIIVKSALDGGNPSYYLETISEKGFVERVISEDEIGDYCEKGNYEWMTLNALDFVPGRE